MNPVVVHEPVAAVAFWACAGVWLIGELVFACRTTLSDPAARDASVAALMMTTLGGLALGAVVAHEADGLTLPGPGWWPLVVGLAAPKSRPAAVPTSAIPNPRARDIWTSFASVVAALDTARSRG